MTEGDTAQKRQVAIKVMAKDLTLGKYVVEEGWKPNYIITQYGRVSRVNIMASIIATSEKGLKIDDGSANMNLRWFEDNPQFSSFKAGDLVNIIGRPREYNKEIYLVPEIIRKIEDPSWIELRKKELQEQPKEKIEIPEEKEMFVEEKIEEDKPSEDPVEKIISMVRVLDEGEGADIEEVISESKVENADSLIKKLMEEGDLFEIKPGKLKVLE